MNTVAYDATLDAVKELLDGDGHFVVPASLLCDLTEEQATTAPPGSPYSIAQVVVHLQWCQGGELAAIKGENWLSPEHLDDTFSPIPEGSWQALLNNFLDGIDEAKQLAEAKGRELDLHRDDTTVNYNLAGNALHNAYHLGQIVLLRRMMGLWPPADGEPYDY